MTGVSRVAGLVLTALVLATVLAGCGSNHPGGASRSTTVIGRVTSTTATATATTAAASTRASAPAATTTAATTTAATTVATATATAASTTSGASTIGAPALLGGPRVSGAGGKFAGYVYQGGVSSLGASWQVPAVAANSRLGKASTWIGAQAPGSTLAPFIQIGTQEEMRAAKLRGRPPVRFYEAFFSDAHRAFHPYSLFAVRAGDEMVARMRLTDRRWHLTITDQSTGATDSFSTAEEAGGAFNYALWLQEDVTNTAADTTFPYPDVAVPRMSSLLIDGTVPTAAELQSTWMSLPGGYLGPTPLRAGAFSVVAQRLSGAGARYLTIAGPENAEVDAFAAEVDKWPPSTPHTVVERETGAFAADVSANLAKLRAAPWPASVASLIAQVESADEYALPRLAAASKDGAVAVFAAFRDAQARFFATASAVAQIRRRLKVEQIAY